MTHMQNIAWVGCGSMGLPMAQHLMNAGYTLHVYARRPEQAAALKNSGAHVHPSLAAACAVADCTITIAGAPADVRQLYLASDGIIAHAKANSLLIDMTTSEPSLAAEIAAVAKQAGHQALDAPVSGGDKGAQAGTLSIMCGGSDAAFTKALPLFNCMGSTVVHHGPAGHGQRCKMVNQIAVASTMVSVSEALSYATHAGLDTDKVLTSVGGGAASSWALVNLGPRMLADEVGASFSIKHFIKDLGIAINSAEAMHLQLPGLHLAKQLYERVADELHGEAWGTQALFRLYRK